MSNIHEHHYQQAQEWVRQAGSLVRDFLKEEKIVHETKSHEADLVTVVDRAVEKFLVELIDQHFPDHKVLGEEGMGENTADFSGYVWLIDPIDGTSNFVTQQCDFVISIALYQDQQGIFGIIYDVMRDEMIHAMKGKGVFVNENKVAKMNNDLRLIDSLISVEYTFRTDSQLEIGKKLLELYPRVRGVRSYGATALSLAKVAVGKNNGYITLGTNPWDHAAGRVLVEEAGGVVTDFEGKELPLDRRSSVVACHPGIYSELLNFVIHI